MKYRKATRDDLLNPSPVFPFFVTVPELGLSRAFCTNYTQFTEEGVIRYIMRLGREERNKILPHPVKDRTFSLSIACTLDEIEVIEHG